MQKTKKVVLHYLPAGLMLKLHMLHEYQACLVVRQATYFVAVVYKRQEN